MSKTSSAAQTGTGPQKYARTLILAVAFLVLAGWVMLLDTGLIFQGQADYAHFSSLVQKRALCSLIGVIVLVALWVIPPDRLRSFSIWMMPLSIGLLALVWSPLGIVERGCRRWVAIGPIAFQPLEFAKLTTVWFLAHTFAGLGPLHKARASHLIVPILLCAAVVGMVGAQPNLSGAVFLILIAFIMAWIGGVNLRLAVPMVLGGLGVFAGLIALNPDRLARFLPVISPLRDLQGVGYQAGLSLWAVTRGGLFGLGPGGSVAMYSLPDHTTDFIYSIICEEWGVAGGILVIGLFGLLGWSAFRLALMQRDTFRLMLGCGVAAMLVLQAGINIGVTLGVFPTTGIPLPFISAGGSSLVLTLGEVGLLLNLGRTAGVQIAREQRVPGCNTPRALHREEVAASPGSKYGRGDRVVYSDRRRRIAR